MGIADAIRRAQDTQEVVSSVVGSPEQEMFWDWVVNREENLILRARAGTGKTFSCIEGMNRLPAHLNVGIVAYNKPIQEELARKVPRGRVAYTAHALGFKACREQNCFRKSNTVDARKPNAILKDLLGEKKFFQTDRTFKAGVKRLVSLCKNTMTGCVSEFGAINEEIHLTDEMMHRLIFRFGLDLNGQTKSVMEIVPEVLRRSLDIATYDYLDFDDMIWLPLMKGWDLEQYDVMFVDECQDLNRARQELVYKASDRLILVGDDRQAIYGFAGADATSMSNMEEWLGQEDRGVKVLGLTMTRRCPKLHVENVTCIVEDFLAMEEAPEGSIEDLTTGEMMSQVQKGDLVICRTNAPLTKTAYALLANEISVQIQGKDIGDNLVNFIQRFEQDGVADINTLMERLGIYEIGEEQRLRAADAPDSQIELLIDRCECVRQLSSGLSYVSQLIARIKKLFVNVEATEGSSKEMSRFVLLSSVHRAKGLEADTVWILHPELMPHPAAKQEWELEQEYNLKYVAETRSLDRLIYVSDN